MLTPAHFISMCMGKLGIEEFDRLFLERSTYFVTAAEEREFEIGPWLGKFVFTRFEVFCEITMGKPIVAQWGVLTNKQSWLYEPDNKQEFKLMLYS